MDNESIDNAVLRKLQETELNILTDLDKFCSEYDIKYSLFAGTAIGAVRHKGFIPWDDDIDIIMTRSEYTRFLKAYTQNPISGYSLDCPELNEECSISHAKLIKNGTLLLSEGEYENIGNHGIWVDIFPLDKVTDNTSKKIFGIGKKIILLTRSRTKNRKDTLTKKVIRFLVRMVPRKLTQKKIDKCLEALNKNDLATTDNYKWTELAATYTFEYRFDEDMMDNIHRIEFEGKYFLIVDDYDSMLRQLYGDYMQLPPVEKQVAKHKPVKIVF